jgi:hypothetical protein
LLELSFHFANAPALWVHHEGKHRRRENLDG